MNSYRAHRPTLRDDCGMQLQRAWQDGLWANIINMAKSKAKLSKDPYFEALELAARSQLDTPLDRQAAWQAVDKILDGKVVVKDPATADLYDWALVSTGMTSDQYPKYIGAMRVNVVKANPKAKEIAKTSFFSCVANADWEHAQQIAAVMDKSFPAERSFHFRNVITTYIYATSLDDNDVKKSMFRTLAMRQIEKAKTSRPQDSSSEPLPPRVIATQDEMLLWLNMVIKETKGDDLVKCLTDPNYNPLSALKDGFETICSTMMDQLKELGAWDEFYTICKAIFEKGVAFWLVEEHEAKEKAKRDAQPKEEKSVEQKAAELMAAMNRLNITSPEELLKARLAAESIATRTIVKDWKMWENFIMAASKQPKAQSALAEVEKFFTRITEFGPQHAIYRTQLDMAKLIIVFETPSETQEEIFTLAARVEGLRDYIDSHYRDMSCFDNLRRFFGLLSPDQAKNLVVRLPRLYSDSEESQFRKIMLQTFHLRLRYFFTTSSNCYTPSSTSRGATCGICRSDAVPERCDTCLKEIAKECIWIWKAGLKDKALLEQLKSEGVSPYTDLTIIGSVCLLKLAGLDGLWGRNDNSPLAWADRKRVMQAILWMDAQHHSQSIKRQDLSVLLVKLYVLIGAASHAKSIWDSLEVKNVTLNCLGPLFADRLGTMAPGLWQNHAHNNTPTSQYLYYYRSAINKNIPNSLRLSFDHGSYASILGNLVTKTKHKQSCTLVMALVDHYRGIRSVDGEVMQGTWQDELAQHIKPGMRLYDTTDYGPFPNIEANPDRPIQDFLSIGPGLSEDRAHLSLLSERFLSLIAYKEPKDYKPGNADLAKDRDRNVVIPACQDMAERMATLLNGADIRDKLTLPEVEYYTMVQGLASYVGLSLSASKGDGLDRLVESIRCQLVNQVTRLTERRKTASEADVTRVDVFHDVSALHANGMLRESVLVTVHMIRYLDRARGADPKSPMPKWMMEHIRILREATRTANRRLKEYIERLSTTVNPAGWADRIAEWAFGDLANGTRAVSDDADETYENSDADMLLYKAIGPKRNFTMAIDLIVHSWAEAARGWSKVKLID